MTVLTFSSERITLLWPLSERTSAGERDQLKVQAMRSPRAPGAKQRSRANDSPPSGTEDGFMCVTPEGQAISRPARSGAAGRDRSVVRVTGVESRGASARIVIAGAV